MNSRALVVAKAPVPGRVKTRLGEHIGMAEAADVAAASLVDTLLACTEAFGPDECLLALDGDLADAVRGGQLRRLLDGWRIGRQRGVALGERLANAHLDVPPGGPVVQIGMDTPQVTPALLVEAAAALDGQDAVLGPADDGGWWVLVLRRPSGASALRAVPMSTPTTYDDTRAALVGDGLTVGVTGALRDVDTVGDAEQVAAQAPDGEFARAWHTTRSDRG